MTSAKKFGVPAHPVIIKEKTMIVEFLTDGKTGDHATDVLYPAIKRALMQLGKLPPCFNTEVDKSFNGLRVAFFSESPPTKDDDEFWPIRP